MTKYIIESSNGIKYEMAEELFKWLKDNPMGTFIHLLHPEETKPELHNLNIILNNHDRGETILADTFRLTMSQATAYSAAIEALLEYINCTDMREPMLWQEESGLGAKVANTANKARDLRTASFSKS